jgi:acyl-CoA synthetase (AMP-forming)/AMP-acid ligase II
VRDPGVRTVADLICAAAERAPDAEFLRFSGRSLTFRDVERLTSVVASSLAGRGIVAGDRVGIMLPNGLDFPVCWLAVLRLGAVAVPISVLYRSADLLHVLADSDARLVIVGPPQAAVADEACVARGLECEVVAPEVLHEAGSGADLGPGADLFGPEALANLQYTSGTTGFPKACMLTHGYWLRIGTAVADHVELSSEDVVLTAQPFSYLDPQWNVIACLVAGASLVIAPRFSASEFWASVRDEGVTFLYTIGAMPVLLIKQPPDMHDRDHRVRVVLCSGIVPEMHRELEERWGVSWRESYGMTETGADLLVPLEDDSTVGSGAVGRPIPGKRIKVVDEAGREVPQGDVGELVISGQPMMLGYWNQPEATARTMQRDGLHTGDLVFVDADGYVHIVGRTKDMVRRSGENVAAAEVEGVLCQHAEVRNAAVVAVSDAIRGEEVRAVIQLADLGIPKNAELAGALAGFVRERLAAFKVPRYVTFVDCLPLTPSGRVAKHQLPTPDDPLSPTFDLAQER